MIAGFLLLPFIYTLLDIALLRKGPQHIPRSGVMLLFALVLWLLSRLVTIALLGGDDERSFGLEVFSTLIMIVPFAAVIVITGFGARLLQSMTALLGFAALLRIIFVAARTLLEPFLGSGVILLMWLAAILWSVAVTGNIIATAIGRHWYVGLAIASLVTILQIAFLFSRVSAS